MSPTEFHVVYAQIQNVPVSLSECAPGIVFKGGLSSSICGCFPMVERILQLREFSVC